MNFEEWFEINKNLYLQFVTDGMYGSAAKFVWNGAIESKECNLDINYKKIIDYLNEKIGKRYRVVPMTKRLINGRVREGFKEDDFLRVIDNQVAKWGNNAQMKEYLRPITLFSTKFESYLNNKPEKQDPEFESSLKFYKRFQDWKKKNLENNAT